MLDAQGIYDMFRSNTERGQHFLRSLYTVAPRFMAEQRQHPTAAAAGCRSCMHGSRNSAPTDRHAISRPFQQTDLIATLNCPNRRENGPVVRVKQRRRVSRRQSPPPPRRRAPPPELDNIGIGSRQVWHVFGARRPTPRPISRLGFSATLRATQCQV